MSRLRRFLPPQVADLIVASGTEKQLESHRREITALFCDLRGFTGFTESADAEDVMALLREYHAAIGEKIIKYSGTLERYAGDGVMVVFNDPVPVENPALQAVLMALEMRDAIGALTETWRRWGHDIGFGIGIAHGFATLGTIGFEGRFDYAAIGTVSNVASRLCDEAKPGQILISPRVLTKVENAVKVEPVGEFELKGIRRPLAAYNVVSVQSSDRRGYDTTSSPSGTYTSTSLLDHAEFCDVCYSVFDAKASAQRRRLVGAAERRERIGGDPGRVLGPEMILSESFLVGHECSLACIECFGSSPSASSKRAKL